MVWRAFDPPLEGFWPTSGGLVTPLWRARVRRARDRRACVPAGLWPAGLCPTLLWAPFTVLGPVGNVLLGSKIPLSMSYIVTWRNQRCQALKECSTRATIEAYLATRSYLALWRPKKIINNNCRPDGIRHCLIVKWNLKSELISEQRSFSLYFTSVVVTGGVLIQLLMLALLMHLKHA